MYAQPTIQHTRLRVMRREARLRRDSDNLWQDWLTPEQELMRLRGLRILARMIARRHLQEYGPLSNGETPARTGTSVDSKSISPEDPRHVP